MRKVKVIVLLMLTVFMMSGCIKQQLPLAEQIVTDINSKAKSDLIISEVKIMNETSNSESKTCTMTVEAFGKNEEKSGTEYYIVEYSRDDQGWNCKKVSQDTTGVWIYKPLAEPKDPMEGEDWKLISTESDLVKGVAQYIYESVKVDGYVTYTDRMSVNYSFDPYRGVWTEGYSEEIENDVRWDLAGDYYADKKTLESVRNGVRDYGDFAFTISEIEKNKFKIIFSYKETEYQEEIVDMNDEEEMITVQIPPKSRWSQEKTLRITDSRIDLDSWTFKFRRVKPEGEESENAQGKKENVVYLPVMKDGDKITYEYDAEERTYTSNMGEVNKFNEKGQLIATYAMGGDPEKDGMICEYDEKGNVVAKNYYLDGELDYTYNYTYYSNGNVKSERCEFLWQDGYSVYHYAQDGRKTKCLAYDEKGNPTWRIEYEYASYTEEEYSCSGSQYNEEGILVVTSGEVKEDNTVTSLTYYDGQILNGYTEEFDENGNVILSRSYGENGVVEYEHRYEYQAFEL